MIIFLTSTATTAQIAEVTAYCERAGYSVRLSKDAGQTVVSAFGDGSPLSAAEIRRLPGVERAAPISAPYKRASRETHAQDTVVDFGPLRIGGQQLVVMAGPCAVESLEGLREIARAVHEAGATMLRGGAFKPRTSPYSFQGLADVGLEYLQQVRALTGLPVVTEVTHPELVERVAAAADMLQIGARNMQNFALLQAVGASRRPVLLKRGMMSTAEELLMAAEYILSHGNPRVVLCERGIRTFETATRNTVDISVVPLLKRLTHLPVIVDPSHGTGRRDLVEPVARAAIAAGADGLMIEVHDHPDKALSDGPQSLHPHQFAVLMDGLRDIASAVGRTL